jgi:hypothetical protein
MSPVTHFLASWVLASFPRLDRRDVAIVTLPGGESFSGVVLPGAPPSD